ncbi:hypothetical protein, partial [Sphingobium yanoikuyae]|uniref:hypothetical protein n=1 Tax=Sphingobium yanoikuyae TaxID=13690 RepID=UPI002FDDEF2A
MKRPADYGSDFCVRVPAGFVGREKNQVTFELFERIILDEVMLKLGGSSIFSSPLSGIVIFAQLNLTFILQIPILKQNFAFQQAFPREKPEELTDGAGEGSDEAHVSIQGRVCPFASPGFVL